MVPTAIGAGEGRRLPARRHVGEPQHQVGRRRPLLGPPDSLALDDALGLAQAGRVDQRHRVAAEVEPHLDQVAGGARLRRHDGDVALGYRIDKAGLSGVRRAEDDDLGAVAEPLAAPVGKMVNDFFFERPRRVSQAWTAHRAGHVVLVGKIELRLDQRPGADEPLAPAVVELPERAVGLPQRLPALRLGLGEDEVGEPLDLGQVHALVGERAARELAGLGRAEAGEGAKRIEDGGDHGAAAVDVQLGHVLAGETRRGGKEQDQPAVEQLAVRVSNGVQARPAWFRNRIDQRFESESDAGSAQPYDGDAGRRRAGGEGEDGVGLGQGRSSLLSVEGQPRVLSPDDGGP